jgi:hypothetical protein
VSRLSALPRTAEPLIETTAELLIEGSLDHHVCDLSPRATLLNCPGSDAREHPALRRTLR